jgi:hypothetical protein
MNDPRREPWLRAQVLSAALLTILVDLSFLGGVAVLNWLAQRYIFDRFTLEGTADIAFDILKWCFTLATLTAVSSFLVRDTFIAIARPWHRDR